MTILIFLFFIFLIMSIVHMMRSKKYKEQEYIERGMSLPEIKEYRAQLAEKRAFERKVTIIGVIVVVAILFITGGKW